MLGRSSLKHVARGVKSVYSRPVCIQVHIISRYFKVSLSLQPSLRALQILMPDSRVRMVWDLVCAVLILFECLAIPYSMSFLDESSEGTGLDSFASLLLPHPSVQLYDKKSRVFIEK